MDSNAQHFEKVFRAFPAEMVNRSRTELKKLGKKYIRVLQVKHLTGGTSPNRLAVRTGDLRRSFFEEVIGFSLDTLALVIISGSKYAAIHEYGGDIKAKPGKMLALPLGEALTPAGVARFPSPRSPGAPMMHILTYGRNDGKSRALLVDSISGEPMYLLVKAVKIPARMHARDTMEEFLPVIAKGLGRVAVKVWKELT
jgi:phage gpG-like protein